uniref:RNA helicase n=1 Tax=Poecilia latipinna TaxID=48699 RepID=A0A3B3VDX9_9TELE
MDTFELFRKLGAGAKFDLKRFGQDAARFKVLLITILGGSSINFSEYKLSSLFLSPVGGEPLTETQRGGITWTSSLDRKIQDVQKDGTEKFSLKRLKHLHQEKSDKLFEDGKTGFREQLATIFLACSNAKVRRAFFSATCTPEVEKWCRLNLDNLVSVNIGHRNTAVETVEQELLFVGEENGKLVAMRDIIKKGFLPPMLVFVQSIERARELFHELVYEGINVDVIHAERTQQQRDNVVNSFRSGKIWVLICTALLARGIDFKGVNLVLNYDFPTSAVEYIHRIGRTGRAGHQGKAITFFTENDKPLLRSIANVIKQAGCPVPDYMVGFKKIHSKVKRRLEKKPPSRSTICTTPRFLMKKKVKAEKKEHKKASNSKQKGENGTQTAQQQDKKKKTKGKVQKAGQKKGKPKAAVQKGGSKLGGAKLKK